MTTVHLVAFSAPKGQGKPDRQQWAKYELFDDGALLPGIYTEALRQGTQVYYVRWPSMVFRRCFPDSNLQRVKVTKWSTNLQKTCIFWWTYFLSRNFRRIEFGDLITFVFLGIWTTKPDFFRIHFPKSKLERADSVCQKCQTAVKLVKLSEDSDDTFWTLGRQRQDESKNLN